MAELLKLRFNEKTRIPERRLLGIIDSASFPGISLYAMAIILREFLGWRFATGVVLAAVFVLLYVVLGGLKATIYNEVLAVGTSELAGSAPAGNIYSEGFSRI